ncbi:MAG: hypothetical protein K0S04_4106, partial [Herbinix sp.]|nr:hypothetical protein [Herbinix sp.]
VIMQTDVIIVISDAHIEMIMKIIYNKPRC